MRLHKFVGGLCGLSMLTGVGAVTVVAAPSGAELEVYDLDVDPDPSTVGETVAISNADEDGRCGGEVAIASEHEESPTYVELTIEPPTGDPVVLHVATDDENQDWSVDYISEEVGLHEVTGFCYHRFGAMVEFAAGPDLVAAPAGEAPARPVHAYEGEFTVQDAPDPTTTTTTTTTPTPTPTPTTAPAPAAGADTRTPPAAPAQAAPTFVG